MSKNAKSLTFYNLLGSSSNVFYNSIHCAHIDCHGGTLSPDKNDYRFQWCAGVESAIPLTGEEILTEYLAQRKDAWDKETGLLDNGWTQWDPLNYEQWEDKNRERLAKALKPFGLKVEWRHNAQSDSHWFRVIPVKA
jgi:hypothetical protein